MTHHKIISTTVTSTILLDSGNDLLITATGQVAPVAAGTAAIIVAATAAGDRIVNRGTITGGVGPASQGTLSGGTGGIGIAELATASIANSGDISGGVGGAGNTQSGGTGGLAILLDAGSTLGNTGSIAGGVGGAGSDGGTGGIAIHPANTAHIANSGTITGGAGGLGSITNGTQYLGAGAAAIVLSTGDVIANAGTILGGANVASTSGTAGAGLVAGLDDRITNSGTIAGGYGLEAITTLSPYQTSDQYGMGGSGVTMGSTSFLTNRGRIVGGTAGAPDGTGGLPNMFVSIGIGGYGLWMRDGSTTNVGTIAGGYGGSGGVAVYMAGGSVTNAGDITGGDATSYGQMGGPYFAGPGGIGLIASGHSTIDNSGTIAGGQGGTTLGYIDAAVGGNAVVLSNGSKLINRGYIQGGEAGFAGAIIGGAGLGAVLTTGASLINYGLISAGSGYTTGGAGLTLASGATASNYGTIMGAVSTANFFNQTKPGSLGGDGVDMAGGKIFAAGVLMGGAGAAYDNPYFPDITYGGNGGNGITVTGGTLVAAGTFVGGAGGIGKDSTGLQGDAVAINADNNTLILQPTAAFYGLVAASGQNDTLDLTGTGGRLIGLGTEYTGFQTIEEDAGAAWSLAVSNQIGTATNLQINGALTVNALGDNGLTTIATTGSILDTGSLYFLGVDNNGSILDRGDLALGSLTGTGQVTLAADSTLQIYPGGTADQTIAFTGPNIVVDLDDPTALSGTISGFGFADSIDFLDAKITSATFADGALTLLDGTKTVATLQLHGDYTTGSFTLASDGHGGTLLKT